MLVAELLLQRTRAEQVLPVYEQFLSEYPSGASGPNPEKLADLLKSLGLPQRVERIHGILLRLRADFAGAVPSDPDQLDRLLGGAHHYVRNAVLVYAFGRRSAPLDRTTARVLSRVFLGTDPSGGKPHTSKQLTAIAEGVLPSEEARAYNLALLDFAATICRPLPRCEVCPMRSFCPYAANTGRDTSASP